MVSAMASPATAASRRGVLSVVLIVLASAVAVVGAVTLYAREEIVTTKPFVERAGDALDKPAVRQVVAREITVQLVDRGSTDLISARPLIESVAEIVIGTQPFRRIFRVAATDAHRLLFVRDHDTAELQLPDVGRLLVPSLRGIAPKLAGEIPTDVDADLVKLRAGGVGTATLRLADRVRLLGVVLPALALLLYWLGVTFAPDRRVAVARVGIGIAGAAAVVIVALGLLERSLVNGLHGSDELTDSDVRSAGRGLWDAYFGDLRSLALIVGGLGLVGAAAAASLMRPLGQRGTSRAAALLAGDASPRRRVLRGAVAVILALAVGVDLLHLREALAIGVAALLLYYGIGELLSTLREPEQAEAAGPGQRRRLLVAAGAAAASVGVVALALALLLGSGGGNGTSRGTAAAGTCNGYAQLCARRLDQVVFAGTHNSMSAADSPGWALANQRRTIERQLYDGVRLFLIDPHYGVRDPSGRVRTDFAAEGQDRNRVAKRLSPEALAAVERLGGELGLGSLGGKREVWLCHSVCELGATRMVDALETMRTFLKHNPGEVLIVFDEDFVSERDVAAAYKQAGLLPYLATLDRSRPLPTLRQLIRSGRRVIVFTERTPGGAYPWNHFGFSFIQDTPLGVTKPADFSCARNRGDADSPLLMLNGWIDQFPPPLEANRAVTSFDFIVQRAQRCARERGMLPNLIATDFYDQGRLVDAVRDLNGLHGQRPSPPH